jgi:signal transduction histidine kinase
MVDVQPSPRRAVQQHVAGHLVDIVRLLLSGVDLAEVLQNVARGACEVVGYERCVVVTAAPGSDLLQGRAGCGVAAEDVARIELPFDDVPELAELLLHGAPLVVPPEQVRDVIPPMYADMFRVRGTLVVVPLASSSSALRGLVFVDRVGHRFSPSEDELTTLLEFADLAALVVQNAMLAADSQHLAALLERSRMASHLHDGVTQLLFAADMSLQEALAVPRLPAAARRPLDRARTDVAAGSRQLRAALYELTQDRADGGAHLDAQSAPEGDPWLAEVRATVDRFFTRSGVSADVQVRGDGRPPPPQAHAVLLRTVREGLANIVKHAHATEALVVVRRSDHWWMVEVHDDGCGDPVRLRRALTSDRRFSRRTDSGYGLASLKRETALVGGRLWLSESPRLKGLQLTASVPTEPSA